MRTKITELSNKVVVIESETSLPQEQVRIILEQFKIKGIEVIWLQV